MKNKKEREEDMKRYVKPEIYYENFELSTHIAACAWDKGNAGDPNSCYFTSDGTGGYPSGITAFTNTNVCGDFLVDDYCYSNGSSGMNIFNS